MPLAPLPARDVDQVVNPTFFVMPAADCNPPNPGCADFGGHRVAELEARRRDPNEPLRVDTKFPARVVADNDKRRLLLHTAVKLFSFMWPFEVALGVVGVHQAG